MDAWNNGCLDTAPPRLPNGRRFDFRFDARPFWLSPLRSMATDLALRAEFDVDAAADLTLAVDEAVAELIKAAVADEHISGCLEVTPTGIRVTVCLPPAGSHGPRILPTDTFGWHVLRTLADHVELIPDEDDAQGAVGILLVKYRAPADRS
jgi:serine/threonine-protein kinase RsbW